jgi:hypothetical protein
MKRKVLVAACARSGTLYINQVLQAAGMKVGHEYTAPDGTVSCYYGTSKQLPLKIDKTKEPKGLCPHVGERRSSYQFEVVLHQVRDPLKVIHSNCYVAPAVNHIKVGCGVDTKGMSRARRALIYWVLWNKEIEKLKPTHRYRVEDMDKEWPTICKLLGLPEQPLPHFASNTHTELRWTGMYNVKVAQGGWIPEKEKKRLVETAPPLTWADMDLIDPKYAVEARALAVKYGYTIK